MSAGELRKPQRFGSCPSHGLLLYLLVLIIICEIKAASVGVNSFCPAGSCTVKHLRHPRKSMSYSTTQPMRHIRLLDELGELKEWRRRSRTGLLGTSCMRGWTWFKQAANTLQPSMKGKNRRGDNGKSMSQEGINQVRIDLLCLHGAFPRCALLSCWQ